MTFRTMSSIATKLARVILYIATSAVADATNTESDASQVAIVYAFVSFLLVMITLHCCLRLQQRIRSGRKVGAVGGVGLEGGKGNKDSERLLQSEDGTTVHVLFTDDDTIA